MARAGLRYASGVRALLLIVVAACWSSSQPAAPAPAPAPEPVASSNAFRPRLGANPCQRTVDNIAAKLRPDFAQTGFPEAVVDELIEAVIESCKEMQWSPELLQCLDGASGSTDINQCQTHMTTEQSEDISRRMIDIVQRMHQSTSPPPPPGP